MSNSDGTPRPDHRSAAEQQERKRKWLIVALSGTRHLTVSPSQEEGWRIQHGRCVVTYELSKAMKYPGYLKQ